MAPNNQRYVIGIIRSMNGKLLRYNVSVDFKPNNNKTMIWNLSILIKKTLNTMNVS